MRFNRYKNSHTHSIRSERAHTRENSSFQIFSACIKTYCRRNVFIGTLGSHTSTPAEGGGIGGIGGCYFDFLWSTLCVFRHFPCHLGTLYVSPWVQTNSYNSVEVLSVTDSLVWITRPPFWIAQGHSFLRSDLAIHIPTQCCNSFSSDWKRACQSRAGIIMRAPAQKIILYRQNVKIWKFLALTRAYLFLDGAQEVCADVFEAFLITFFLVAQHCINGVKQQDLIRST